MESVKAAVANVEIMLWQHEVKTTKSISVAQKHKAINTISVRLRILPQGSAALLTRSGIYFSASISFIRNN